MKTRETLRQDREYQDPVSAQASPEKNSSEYLPICIVIANFYVVEGMFRANVTSVHF